MNLKQIFKADDAVVCPKCKGIGFITQLSREIECSECNSVGYLRINGQVIASLGEANLARQKLTTLLRNENARLKKQLEAKDKKPQLTREQVYPAGGRKMVAGQVYRGD